MALLRGAEAYHRAVHAEAEVDKLAGIIYELKSSLIALRSEFDLVKIQVDHLENSQNPDLLQPSTSFTEQDDQQQQHDQQHQDDQQL